MMELESDLLSNPDLVLELLAVVAKRAGGTLSFSNSEGLGPFNLRATKYIDDDDGGIYLKLVLIEEQVGTA